MTHASGEAPAEATGAHAADEREGAYGIARSPGERPPPAAPGKPPENGAIDRVRYPRVAVGEGYAVGHFDDLGDGEGFRNVRRGLGVTAFGVNVLVRQPGYETKAHFHDIQEELYFVHAGAIEIRFADGSCHTLESGCFARVDAGTVRQIKVLGPRETIYLCVGGKDGYVGHDGRAAPEVGSQ